MIKLFGVTGTCILAAVAVGIGFVGLVVWAWFGSGDDDDDWEDWLPDEENEEDKDGDR